MYSAKEMKSKIGNGKSKVREMKIKDNKSMRIWIPRDEFIHLVKHFNIQTVDKFKHAATKAVTCINSDVDEEKKVCPVCDYINSLWKQWRSTVDKDEKKKLQDKINRLIADFYYVNAVDVTDMDAKEVKELLKSGDYSRFKCESLRITPPIFKQICAVISPDEDEDDGKEISTVIWIYKKAVTGQTRYSINEIVSDPVALLLQKRIEQICDRPEKDGGYIDLDKGYNEHQEQKAYIAKLYGDEDDEPDVLDEDEETEEKPAPKKAASKKPVKKEPEVEEDDEDVSLDDLDEEPAKPAKKTAVKKPVVDEDLDDDDELEAGTAIEDLDPDDVPAPKKVAPAKAARKPVVDLEDDDLDDDIDVKPAKKTVKPAAKKPVVDDDDLDDDDLDEEPAKPVKKAVPAKKPAVKKPVIEDDDDIDIDDLEDI